MQHSFDAVIIGTGQAGPPLAGRLTKAGWKVAVIERDLVGGTCVNRGCTPTKAMVASAKVAYMARRADEFGVNLKDSVRVDLRAVKARKDKIVAASHDGLEKWLQGMDGCTLFRGTGVFEAADRVRVGDDVLTAKHIFVNVGERPRVPAEMVPNEVPYLTSSSILELEELPEHLVVVGGSYVGLEFAQMFRRFGSKVTVVERAPALLGHEDEDIAKAVQETLEAEDVQFRMNAECIHLEKHADGVAVHMTCSVGSPSVVGSHVLLAVGRQPNTDDLGLAEAGIYVDQKGYILIDDALRTNVEGIWALGDCNGKGGFTHTSYNDFEIVAANLLDKDARKVSDRIACHATYIDPPLAQVGLNEKAVRASRRRAKIGTRPMTKVARALEKGESRGLMKVLVDAETDEILGATIFGVGGDEAIHCILTAMYAKQPAELLRRSVHIHPTVAELIPTMLEDLKPLE
jgi:pyruvate/2-oxoglutarate dehydrogenase complex dihydrolipoamide dehydrogenase (E3) component